MKEILTYAKWKSQKLKNEDRALDECYAFISQNLEPDEIKISEPEMKIFNDLDLKSTIECNLKTVDFFNVALHLKNCKYFIYRKEKNDVNYIIVSNNLAGINSMT